MIPWFLICMSNRNNKDKAIYQEALDYGIDLNLIDCNLRLTYEDRVRQHQIALDLFLKMKEKHCQLYGEFFKTN